MTQRRRIFGTDGVRGTANIEPVTADTILKLGCAAAHVFKVLHPERLEGVNVGDTVELTFTEALALKVVEASAK